MNHNLFDVELIKFNLYLLVLVLKMRRKQIIVNYFGLFVLTFQKLPIIIISQK